MRRSRTAAVVPALALLAALTACATGSPASAEAIAERAEPAGIAPDLVWTADLSGFSLAVGSVGPYADEGMSSIWTRVADDGLAMVTLLTTRQPDPEAVPCAELADAVGAEALTCDVAVDGGYVTLRSEGVSASALREIAESVHVPSATELDRLFADVPTFDGPTERGDLPPGDGAPDNSVGEGG
jgi:hypothetical protein